VIARCEELGPAGPQVEWGISGGLVAAPLELPQVVLRRSLLKRPPSHLAGLQIAQGDAMRETWGVAPRTHKAGFGFALGSRARRSAQGRRRRRAATGSATRAVTGSAGRTQVRATTFGPQAGVGCECTGISDQVGTRWWDDAGQATDEGDRFEHKVRSTIGPDLLEAIGHPAVVGQLEASGGERRPAGVSTEALEAFSVGGGDLDGGVK
jgi:hypothetical protein